MDVKAMIKRVKAGEPADAVLSEMSKYAAPKESEKWLKDPKATKMLNHLAQHGPTKNDVIFGVHGGKGGAPLDYMYGFHWLGLAVSTGKEWALTTKGVEWAKDHQMYVSPAAERGAADADRAIAAKPTPHAADKPLPPSITGGPSAPKAPGEAPYQEITPDSVKKTIDEIPVLLKHLASSSKLALKYLEQRVGGEGGTTRIVISAKKALGKDLETKTFKHQGREIHITELSNQNKAEITKKVEAALRAKKIVATNILVHDSDGDDIPVDVSVGSTHLVLQKPRFMQTGFDPLTGEPIKTMTAGKGQMAWWDIEKYPAKVRERLGGKLSTLVKALQG